MSQNLLEFFYTPPSFFDSEADDRVLKDSKILNFPFGEYSIRVYVWRSGPDILCVHGWGSRAAHMGFMARHLAESGFRVTAFDAPSHGESRKQSGTLWALRLLPLPVWDMKGWERFNPNLWF